MIDGDRVSVIGNRGTGRGCESLEAWRYADDLAVQMFHVAAKLSMPPRVLNSQIIRAATSAPANISEGYGRASRKEFQQYLAVAHSSLYEVAYFLHFLHRVGAIDDERYVHLDEACHRASRLVFGLMRSVRRVSATDQSRRYLKGSVQAVGT
jgi:four helix bundle protein